MTNPSRRTVAILAADIAGYSRLMQLAEDATLAALQAHQRELIEPLVGTHGGRVVKTTGDGMLVEFPTAAQALRCAIATQAGMASRNSAVPIDLRIAYRIGVHVGAVISDGDDIFGHSVNVAARLQALAEPGGIRLSDAVCRQTRTKVDVMIRDLGQRRVKNFTAPLHVYQVVMPEAPAASYPTPVSDRPSVAVLPFDRLSKDRRLEFLADGLVEDLTALVARVSGFFVIARASAFAYRGRTADIAAVARELGVRYIVTGTCRSNRDRVRVTTELTDAVTGEQLWSGRFDGPRSDAFDIHEDIARAIITELEPELTRAEIAAIRRQRPDDPDAWDCYRQAIGAMAFGGWNTQTVESARASLRRAVSIDPAFGLAHAYYAVLSAMGQLLGALPSDKPVRADALAAAERALALDDTNSEALGYVACALSDLGYKRRADEVVRRALRMDPSNAQARIVQGALQAEAGAFDDGIANLWLGMRLSPRDCRLGFWGAILAYFLLRAQRETEALHEAQAANQRDDKFFLARVVEALAALHLGRADQARSALGDALRIQPQLEKATITRLFGKRPCQLIERLWREVVDSRALVAA